MLFSSIFLIIIFVKDKVILKISPSLRICDRLPLRFANAVVGMNQASWGLGFSLFVGHMCSIAGMTLMHWQMLTQSCRVSSLNDLHMQQANLQRGVGAFLSSWDPLPSLVYLPPLQEALLQTGKALTLWHSFNKGETLSIQSIVYRLLIMERLCSHKEFSSLGQRKKTRQYFFVHFTGSSFKIIYLKCIRGEDNLRTHPENSKRLLGIWHLK